MFFFVSSYREFFTNESTAIAWGETYDVSAEKHVSSNEHITLQSTRLSSMSITSQTTRNDSAVMDISTISTARTSTATKNASAHEKLVNFKPLSNPIPADEKENFAILDDMDLTLELPPPAPPSKSFSSKIVPSIFSSSLRPSFSNSTKISMAESSHYGEKTSGSDNMDISGIEPTIDQNEMHSDAGTSKRASEYLKSLKNDNNFLLKNQQKPKSQIEDIQLDDTQVNNLLIGRSKVEVSSRKTINQPSDMSLEVKNQNQLKDISGSSADMSIEALPEQMSRPKMANTTSAIDMEMSHLKPSSASQNDLTNEIFKKPSIRRTVNISHDITTDDFNASKANSYKRSGDISIQLIDPNKDSSKMGTSSLIKPIGKSLKTPSNRRTVNDPSDITIDETNASSINAWNRTTEMSINLIAATDRRKTLLQVQDMVMSSPLMEQSTVQVPSSTATQDISLDDIHIEPNQASNHAAVEKRSSRRQTILQNEDMELDSSSKESNEVMATSSKPQTRQTINKPQNISIEFTEKRPNAPKIFAPLRRQTTHTVQDISLDITITPSNVVPLHSNVKQSARDMTLDDIQFTDSQAVQYGNQNWKTGAPSTTTNRLTINELRDMSFDSNATGKSNTYSRSNKTILGDMSMELQSTDVYGHLNRKSVICKSPNKNVTASAFDRSSLEFTKLIDQNNLSCHSLHTTKLNDRNSSKLSEFELNTDTENSSVDIDIEQNDPEPEAPATGLVSFRPKLNLFAPTQSQTIHSVYDLDISEESSPMSTAKKFNLNKTPYYAELERDNDSSSLELTNNNFGDENQFETNRNEQQSIAASKQCGQTKIFHETINDDSSLLNVPATESIESGRISPASVPLERPKSMNFNLLHMENLNKRSSMPNQSLFQLSSIGSPIQIDDSISTSNTSAPTNLVNISIGANDSSKQLTFIEDDDDEEQICNTKIDLASSLENSENDSMIASMIDMVKPHIASTSAMITSTDQLDPSLCQELNAFKKSNRLRHSNVFETKETANANRSDTSKLNDESVNSVQSSKSILTDIGQSRIMQRRSNNTTTNDEANETSFLKKPPPKKASEVKLDFSGYDEFDGLATPMDVFDDFLQRMEQIDRQNDIWAEQRRKFAAGEIDSFDDINDLDPDSQNVEAPSWTFLYKNQMQEKL